MTDKTPRGQPRTTSLLPLSNVPFSDTRTLTASEKNSHHFLFSPPFSLWLSFFSPVSSLLFLSLVDWERERV